MNKSSKMETKFYIDIILVVVYLIIMEPLFTKLKWHEWVGLGLGIIFLIHIIINWKWVTECTKKFFNKMTPRLRLSYILNFLLLIAAIFMLLSSFAIAKNIDFSWFGYIGLYYTFTWLKIHVASAFTILIIGAIHLGLHWKWIAVAFRKIFAVSFKLSAYLTAIFAIIIVALGIFAFDYANLWVTLERTFTFWDLTNIGEQNAYKPSTGHGQGSGFGAGHGSGSGTHSLTETTTSISILVYAAVAAMIAVFTRYLDILISSLWRQAKKTKKGQQA